MAAPTFVAASAGATDATGAWASAYTTTAACVVILQVFQDGTTADVLGAPPSVGADDTRLVKVSGSYSSLAGTADRFTWIGAFPVGSATTGFQHLFIARTVNTTAISITGSNTTSEDLYYRWYEFTDVSTGTTIAEVIENAVRFFNPAFSLLKMGDATARTRIAQSFVSIGGTCSKATLHLRKTGTPADTLTVALQADSAGVPSGTDLATASMSGDSLTTTAASTEFSWTGVSTTRGSTYWIVLRRSGAVDAANYYEWSENGDAVASVSSATYNPSTWTTGGTDLALQVGQAGTASNGAATSGTVADEAVTTLGPDRLALNFVGLSDDAMGLATFAGATGGAWEQLAIYEESSGTDATIALDASYVGVGNGNVALSGALGPQGDTGTNEQQAQSFSSGSGGAITGVVIWVAKTGSPTDDITVEIQTDSGGVPSGTVVGTGGTLAASSAPASGPMIFTVSATLSASTTYWIVARRSGSRDTSNYVSWYTTGSNSYSGGTPATRNSGTWTAVTNDFNFVVMYSAGATIDGGSDAVTNIGWGVVGFALIGTTVTAVAAPLILEHGFVNFNDPGVL